MSEINIKIKADDLKKKLNIRNGEDYVLKEEDLEAIATMAMMDIEVPVVEKVIERTEVVVKEQPVVTEKITNEIKEVAVTDTPEAIAQKLNTLTKAVSWKVLKDIPENLGARSGVFGPSIITPGIINLRGVTIDLSLASQQGTTFRYTATSNPTFTVINPTDGQSFFLEVLALGANRQISFDSTFGFGMYVTSPVPETVSGKVHSFACKYRSAENKTNLLAEQQTT